MHLIEPLTVLRFMFKILSGLPEFFKTALLSPREKALSITLGFCLSLFPVAGFTTILCVLAILIFKLNPYLVQGINILFMPFQVMLMLPFLKAGRMVFFSEKNLMPEISEVKWTAIAKSENLYYFLESIIGGIAIWGIASLVTGFLLYRLLLKIK